MLDEKDKIILESLLQDCRVTIQELSKRTRLTHPTVLYRIKKLESEDYIEKYDTFIDWNKIDVPFEHFFVHVPNSKKKNFEKFCLENKFLFSIFRHSAHMNYSITAFLREGERKTLIEYFERNQIDFEELNFEKSLTLPYSIYDTKVPRAEVKLVDRVLKLDEVDAKILENASDGGGKDSIVQISNKLRISFDLALYRFKKLKSAGYFLRNIAHPNHSKFHLKYVMCVFDTKDLEFEECRRIVSQTNKVLFFAKDKNSGRYMATFVLESLEELEKCLEKINRDIDDRLLSMDIYPTKNWLVLNRLDLKRLL